MVIMYLLTMNLMKYIYRRNTCERGAHVCLLRRCQPNCPIFDTTIVRWKMELLFRTLSGSVIYTWPDTISRVKRNMDLVQNKGFRS